MVSKISKLQNKVQYFYISLFSYLSMNHGQNQFLVKHLDSSLMMGKKSELVFARSRFILTLTFYFLAICSY